MANKKFPSECNLEVWLNLLIRFLYIIRDHWGFGVHTYRQLTKIQDDMCALNRFYKLDKIDANEMLRLKHSRMCEADEIARWASERCLYWE